MKMVYLENGLQHGIRILENGKILALGYAKQTSFFLGLIISATAT